MEILQLQLDEQLIKQARQVAAVRQATLEELIKAFIQKLATITLVDDPLWGLFNEDVALIDEMIESIMLTRETQPLRITDG